MKSLVTKLFAVLFIVALSTGCASSITAPQQSKAQKQEITNQHQPNPGDVQGHSDMRENVKKPL